MLEIKKAKDRCRCPAFLDYVRAQPCEDCKALGLKQTTRTTASHMVSVKWADGSDALAVPQCLEHHPQSTRSAREIVEKHIADVPALHRKLWNNFLESRGIYVKVFTQSEFELLLREKGLTEQAYSKRKNR